MVDTKELFYKVDLPAEPHLLSPLMLAYIGDAVFELYIRLKITNKTHKVQELHTQVVKYVKAEAQSDILAKWEPLLSQEEKVILRRGRNAKGRVPRNTEMIVYRRSTAFEALIGYLYLAKETDRLLELLSMISFS